MRDGEDARGRPAQPLAEPVGQRNAHGPFGSVQARASGELDTDAVAGQCGRGPGGGERVRGIQQ